MFFDPSGLVDVPANGVIACNEMISACNELIDCLTNIDNYGSSEQLSKDIQRVKNDKIKTNQLLWYSDELNELVNEVIINNDKVTVQQVSCIIEMAYEMRATIISKSLITGQEVLPENQVRSQYNENRAKGTVFLASGGYYPIEGDSLVSKILSRGYWQNTMAEYGGYNAKGVYQDVWILERRGLYKPGSFEQEKYPFSKYPKVF